MEDFPSFNIYEGIAVEDAEVYEDRIIFDVSELNKSAEGNKDVIIGLIAHELAHIFLGHGFKVRYVGDGLKFESEADQLASKWGFEKEIKAFRDKLGRPTDERFSIKSN